MAMKGNIVFVGIGGVGMSAIAQILSDLWYKNIVWINNIPNQITQKLSQRGIDVIIGHGTYEVQVDDVVIYSDIQAIKDGPEVQQSIAYQSQSTRHYHMPWTYNQVLAEISKLFRTIAIAGTNGKTSTTAIAIKAGMETQPLMWLWIIGAMMKDNNQRNYYLAPDKETDIRSLFDQILTGKRVDESLIKKYRCVIEACEHKEHFLLLDTEYTIITNVTYDHQDYYTTPEMYRQAFTDLATQTKAGIVFDQNNQTITTLSNHTAKQIKVDTSTQYQFDYVWWWYRSENTALVAKLWSTINANTSYDHIVNSVAGMQGIRRRMEYLGSTKQEAKIYSDYGHHPDWFPRWIDSARQQFPNQRLRVIFEPHQAQRLISLWDQFKKSLAGVDDIVIYQLYTARESFALFQETIHNRRGDQLTSFDDVWREFATQLDASYIIDKEEIYTYLDQCEQDDIVILFSAWRVDGEIRDYLSKKKLQ